MLQDRVGELFAAAISELDGWPGLVDVRRRLLAEQSRLDEAIRVAVIGRVSAGKSTLTNAILDEALVATGVNELTYNVNWVRYGDDPRVVVHFKDGRPPQTRPLDSLAELTERNEAQRSTLAAVDYLEVFRDLPRLRDYDLIDTPGLDSHFVDDSANTLRFLGLEPDDIPKATKAHASKADAVLHVFGRSLGDREEAVLDDLTEDGDESIASPINAIGVLTKVENYWPAEPDPIAAGQRVAARLSADHRAGRVLFRVIPVASLVAAGASAMTDAQYDALVALSAADPAVVESKVKRGPFFCTRDYPELGVDADARADLFRSFKGWGIATACALLRDGVADDKASLRAALIERSGIDDVRSLISSHFGNRALLIKLRTTLGRVTGLDPSSLAPADADRLAGVVGMFEQFRANEHAFRELDVLRDLYAGALEFADHEVVDIRRVTGEHGVWITDRLGLPITATLDELFDGARDRLVYWRLKDTDPWLQGRTRSAARVVRRSYERLLHHIAEARRHLELVQ